MTDEREKLDPDGAEGQLSKTPRNTGDPELDAIWNGTLGELDAILQDKTDPRYDKARIVYDELFGPLIEAANKAMAPSLAKLNMALGDSVKGLFPDIGRMTLPTLSGFAGSEGIDVPQTVHGIEARVDVHSSVEPLDAEILTAESSPAEAQDALADALARIANTNDDHLDYLRASGEADGKRARRAEIVSWVATAAAVVAVVVSVVK